MKIKVTRIGILFPIVPVMLLSFLSISDSSLAQQDGTAKNREKCSCENLTAKDCAPAYQPPVPPKKKPPLPPIKSRTWKNVYIGKLPPINDKDLPGVDGGTGTAANTEGNYRKGAENNHEHRNADGTMSRNGFYPERRRYVYNNYKYAEERVGREGGITKEQFSKLKEMLKKDLESINEQEREAYYKENKEEFDAQIEDLNNNIDKQNELRTNAIIAEIVDMDIDRYEDLEAAIDQVISENVSQARLQQILGQDDSKANGRAIRILEKLYEKFARDCDKKPLSTQTILSMERLSGIIGIPSDDRLSGCISLTAVARIEVAGIVYEAKKCLSIIDSLPGRGVSRFEGNWFLEISGMMVGSGSADVALGSGNWQSTAELPGVVITQDGPAELVSGGGQCALKIRATNAVGMVSGHRVRMSGVGGTLPIKIVNQTCKSKVSQ